MSRRTTRSLGGSERRAGSGVGRLKRRGREGREGRSGRSSSLRFVLPCGGGEVGVESAEEEEDEAAAAPAVSATTSGGGGGGGGTARMNENVRTEKTPSQNFSNTSYNSQPQHFTDRFLIWSSSGSMYSTQTRSQLETNDLRYLNDLKFVIFCHFEYVCRSFFKTRNSRTSKFHVVFLFPLEFSGVRFIFRIAKHVTFIHINLLSTTKSCTRIFLNKKIHLYVNKN